MDFLAYPVFSHFDCNLMRLMLEKTCSDVEAEKWRLVQSPDFLGVPSSGSGTRWRDTLASIRDSDFALLASWATSSPPHISGRLRIRTHWAIWHGGYHVAQALPSKPS